MTCPTGDLLVLDFGLMELWSGDDPPRLVGGTRIVPDEVAAKANASADFEIVGPDAGAVAAQVDLGVVMGHFAFDVSAEGTPVSERVAAVCGSTGLRARVERIDRTPHRQHSNAEGNCVVVPLRTLIEGEPALDELFRAPAPAAYERRDAGPFVAVDHTPRED